MAKEKTSTDEVSISEKASKKVASEILAANPEMKEVYVTSDGLAFYKRNDAQNHANALKNRDVYNYKRESEEVSEEKTEE